MLLHASCVAIEGKGVLLLGDSGIGKSDLALRLIHHGAVLVADDQVLLEKRDETLYAMPPAAIAGLLEIHGIGIVRHDYLPEVPVVLAIQLVTRENVERLPEAATRDFDGIAIRMLKLHAFDASTPTKIWYGLNHPPADE